MPLLYDGVALGMWLASSARFRQVKLTESRRLEPGTLILVTHRAETDVPLVTPMLYHWSHAAGPLGRRQSLSFAARDDLFVRGFFAGFPPRLPLAARKLLFSLSLCEGLRRVGVHPLRSADTARLVELLPELAELPLVELVGPAVVEEFTRRARTLGQQRPQRAAEVLEGGYADLLWRPYRRDELPEQPFAPFWGRRAVEAAADFRRLVQLVRGGAILILFPEGRPSPDGSLGPIRRGAAALVRRGQPARILPVGLSYDPLGRGRDRAYISALAPVAPTDDPVALLELLRAAMPLTPGQVVAGALTAAEAAGEAISTSLLESEACRALARAREQGRQVEPALQSGAARRRRLAEALEAAGRKRTALAFLAREYAELGSSPS